MARISKIKLTLDNVNRLQDYLNNVKYGLQKQSTEKLLDDISNEALTIFKNNVTEAIKYTEYSSGDIVNSCRKRLTKTNTTKGKVKFKITLYNTSKDFKYFEYGTGIVGKQDPHPLASTTQWQYDINNHGEDGWVFRGNDNKFVRTRGQKASRPLYNAKLEMQAKYSETDILKSFNVKFPKMK